MDVGTRTATEVRERNDVVGEYLGVTRTYERRSASGWFSFGSGRDLPTATALSDVSLTIERRDFVGLSGPSGSGKTTLVHLLAGLDAPTEGYLPMMERPTGGVTEVVR